MTQNKPLVLVHSLHPQHSLMLLDGCSYRCNGCSHIRPGGIRYRCLACDFDLDCTCAALPRSHHHLHSPDPPLVPGPGPSPSVPVSYNTNTMPEYAGANVYPQYQNQGSSSTAAGSGCPHLHSTAPPLVPGPGLLPSMPVLYNANTMPGYAGVDIHPQCQNQSSGSSVPGSGCPHSYHHLHSPAPPLVPGPLPSMPVNYNTMPGYAGVNICPQYQNLGSGSNAAGSGFRRGKREAIKAFVRDLGKATFISLLLDDAHDSTLLGDADDGTLLDDADCSYF